MFKSLILAAGFFLLSSQSQAQVDITMIHKEFCTTPEAMKLTGPGGQCRIAIYHRSPEVLSGECNGKLSGVIPCNVVFSSKLDGSPSTLTLSCGADLNTPDIMEEMVTEVSEYSVVAFIKSKKGIRSVLRDEKDYRIISSDLVNIYQATGSPTEIILSLADKQFALEDLNCK